MTYTIKQGDTAPALEATLLNENNDPAELDLANEVTFQLRGENISITDDTTGNVSILSEDNGDVQYVWEDGQTDVAGFYQAEFIVEYTNGRVQSFPNDDFINVRIEEDINNR